MTGGICSKMTGYYNSAQPCRRAYKAAWVRLARCSFSRILPTYLTTVRS
jgi:hypothetical protein